MKYKEYHLTSFLKAALIGCPAIVGIFVSGVLITTNTVLGFGLYVTTAIYLLVSIMNLFEDKKKFERE